MSWLIPSALGIAGVAALVTIALHLIARSRPLAETLPTARFVPDRPVHARTRSIALSDLLLLLLRLVAIAAIGVAVAGPILPHRGRVIRVVAIDRSASAASLDEVRDSVRALLRTGDILLPFDSATFGAISELQLDSLKQSLTPGSVSTALAAVIRTAVDASDKADSVEVVIVSPLAAEEIDEATSRMRASWPGRMRVVPVRAAAVDGAAPRVEVRAGSNDAVAAGLSLMGVVSQSGNVRVVRGRASASDSVWASDAGHVLVRWPAVESFADWPRRKVSDTVGGVTARGATLVAHFPRMWVLDGYAIARWVDGEPAVVERQVGAGCIRDVAVLIDEASDVALRAPFRAFAKRLVAPCGVARETVPADSVFRASLAGRGPLAAASALRDLKTQHSRWTPWLLALGALLLFVELAARRMMRRSE